MKIIFFLILISINFRAYADTVEIDNFNIVENVPVNKRILSDEELSISGFILGKTKFSEVKAKMESSSTFRVKEGKESYYGLCYKNGNGTILVFEADAEMSGENGVITKIKMINKDIQYKYSHKCMLSSFVNDNITIMGLKLGMLKKDINMKNEKFKEDKNFIVYSFTDYYIHKKTEIGVSSVLILRMSNDKISEISLLKIEST